MIEGKITVVFISGFLTPTDWMSYPKDIIPQNVNLIPVYPSPTGSLHDRACQVFYELFGGTIDYGAEHSDFHKHDRFGRTFAGKLAVWNEENPIIIIGHSLGGCTAWVLQNYLAQRKFAGVETCSAWVSAVICVSTPLNGALQVHTRGMDLCNPPLVRWGSSGCIVGWLAQWTEYFDISFVKHFMDFQQDHWRISWRDCGVLKKLLLSMLGYCLHSGTDNVAYDVTIQSQLQWAKVLQTFPDSRYISVVGNLIPPETPSKGTIRLGFFMGMVSKLLREETPLKIGGVDTSERMASGTDGMLSVHTQEFPRLYTNTPESIAIHGRLPEHPSCFLPKERIMCGNGGSGGSGGSGSGGKITLQPGMWHYTHHSMSHLTTAFACKETWGLLMQAVKLLGEHEPDKNSLNNASYSEAPVECGSQDSTPCTAPCTSTSTSSDSPSSLQECRPDMQSVRFKFPCEETSTGMAYSWGYLYLAALLSSVVFAHLDWSTASNQCFVILCAGLFSVALCYLQGFSRVSGRTTLPNATHVASDVVEVFYAVYRVYAFYYTSSAPDASTFLREWLVQALLPRPLFDYSLQPLDILFSVFVSFTPRLWHHILQTHVLLLLAVVTVLPKLTWLVIYCTQREHTPGVGVVVRDLFTAAATGMFLFSWAWCAVLLYQTYRALTPPLDLIDDGNKDMNDCGLYLGVLLLLAVHPLNKFKDLSMCIQMILIEQHY